jgi:glyoxylase-like metal-dependent hydrolase (beta-lactamase superfamily II)
MNTIAPGIRFVDVRLSNVPSTMATAVLHSPGHVALIDPGPSTSLAHLRSGLEAGGISVQDIDTILLTHIHLDHAGATGALVRENPRIAVYVHERGLPHLADPTKLLGSAARLYGDRMESLWGPFLPVPPANLRALTGSEDVLAGGRNLAVAYTPGHASHHVAYFDPASRVAFTGDVGGIRIPPSSFVLPPTPPPDIDIEAWERSVADVLSWHPDTLLLAHFGVVTTPAPHLQDTLERLHWCAALARECIALADSDEEKAARFSSELSRELRRTVSDSEASRYELAVPPWLCWLGLERYWRKKL